RRTNAQGRPARVPSPWMEKKTSLTLSTRSLRVGRGAAGRFPHADTAQQASLRAEPPADLAEEVTGHHLRRRAGPPKVLVVVEVAVVEARRHRAHRLLQPLEVEDD